MPVTTVRAKLRASLSKKLVPVLIAKGFRGPSDLEGNSLFHEYRRSTDQGTQVLEIQFEKRQLPRFVINLYVEPLGGVKALVRNGGTIMSGRLKARMGATTRSWFRADRSWWDAMILGRRGTIEHEAETLPTVSLALPARLRLVPLRALTTAKPLHKMFLQRGKPQVQRPQVTG